MRESRLKHRRKSEGTRRTGKVERRARREFSARREKSRSGPGRRRARASDASASRRLRSLKRLASKLLGRKRARAGARHRVGSSRTRRRSARA